MFQRCGFLVLVHVLAVFCAPATYDQRQTGDLNVQIHLKDVQVLALLDTKLLDDYTDYDYFYDYADFTVKPIVKPSTTTAKPADEDSSSTTEKTEVTSTVENSTSSAEILSSTEGKPIAGDKIPSSTESSNIENDKPNESTPAVSTEDTGDSGISIKTRINDKTGNLFEEANVALTTRNTMDSSPEGAVQQLSRKRCRSGYSPDGKGRCRRVTRRRMSLMPFAMKIAPKLLETMAYRTSNQPQ